MIKFYFQNFVSIVRWMSVVFPSTLLTVGGISLFTNDLLSAIIFLVLGLLLFPASLITLKALKLNGMSSKLIELANYEFGKDTIPEDFYITKNETAVLDTLIQARVTPDKSVTGVARQLAIDTQLNERKYLYLLVRSLVYGAEEHYSQKPNPVVDQEKLQNKIKSLKEAILKKRRDSPTDPPKSDSKYDFL